MSYVDARFDKKKDVIQVVERDNKGIRQYKEFKPRYEFFYKDIKGKHRSIYGDPLTRVLCKTTHDFYLELKKHSGKELFESDLDPVFKCLAENYLGIDAPNLNICFWDIETDFSPELGYAKPEDPFMAITAITVYLKWLDSLITLSIPPKTLTIEQAREMVADIDNTFVFEREEDMLETFLDLIQDADVISGWNSSTFDDCYTCNRIERLLGREATKKFCLFDQYPKPKKFERFGKEMSSYSFTGIINMDMLDLYTKYTYEEKASYRLDYIGEIEVGENKVPYDGSLDMLYNQDFRKFIEYNRQDVVLLNKLDEKLKYISLAMQMAHENTVLLPTVLGSVSMVEQAIINEAHSKGLRVFNRPKKDDSIDSRAAGAYVAYPKVGICDWVGSYDINSLYPSLFRALNMCNETIIGQLRPHITDPYIKKQEKIKKSFAKAWEGLFGTFEYEHVMNRNTEEILYLDWANGETSELTGDEIYRLIFESDKKWIISANGTIFTYEKEGVIPGLLSRWYSERKSLQAKLKEVIASGDKKQEEYWDKRQLIKKILLNSLYGVMLQSSSRFFDKRIGQSTTLSGRQVVKHMSAKTNEIITGEFDYKGEAIIYNDSVTGDTIILTDQGEMTIAELYDLCPDNYTKGEKEYGNNYDVKVVGYNIDTDKPTMAGINYVMRHFTNKKLYKTTLSNGKSVTVTEDHSLMVDRNGAIFEAKPSELLEGDLFICLIRGEEFTTERTTLQSIECLGEVEDYVYDISINDKYHVFFANDCLVHNTDSCSHDTVIRCNWGEMQIESLFHRGAHFWQENTEHGVKEYSSHSDLQVVSYDPDSDTSYYGGINYIYRHKVSKERWEITDETDNQVNVTGDHSVMVERDTILLEIKPRDIQEDDILISISSNIGEVKRVKIKSIKQLDNYEDEYVYDIGMKNENHPWFFGNNILIHNSVYFSAYSTLKPDIDAGLIPWDKDTVVKLYDQMCEEVNESFVDFMLEQFHCPPNRGSVIKAGREIVATKALFIKKKRYAVLYYDKEGKRVDVDGKPGKIKTTGLDLKRSDTPAFIQDFLSEVLRMVLFGESQESILEYIRGFRTEFRERKGWQKGSPKRANNITPYQAKEEAQGKANMPGHVRASINWNTLKSIYNDQYSMNIVDGAKVSVCKLKPRNQLGFDSVAYPVDELRLPQWFLDLPFDDDEMENVLIDGKLDNLIGVLNWDLKSAEDKNTFNSFFDFGD